MNSAADLREEGGLLASLRMEMPRVKGDKDSKCG